MGYITEYRGELETSKPLTSKQVQIINDWCSKRHDGHDIGIWCDWIASTSTTIEAVDGKNYNDTDWLRYLITNYFDKWGVTLNGDIQFRGEEFGDDGVIECIDSIVQRKGVSFMEHKGVGIRVE